MNNEKGFTLIELLGVLFIISIVLVPLVSSLTSNVAVNARMIRRNTAELNSISAIRAFDEMDFVDLLTQEDMLNHNYLKIDSTTCEAMLSDNSPAGIESNQSICELVFSMPIQNRIIDNPEHFRVFIYPYVLSEEDKEALKANEDIPDYIWAEMDANIRIGTQDQLDSLVFSLFITVDIMYDDETQGRTVRSGVLTRPW